MKYLITSLFILAIMLSGCSSVPDSKIKEYAQSYVEHFKNNRFGEMYKMISERNSGTKDARFKAVHKSILDRTGGITNISKGRIIDRENDFGGKTYEIVYEIEFEKSRAVYNLKVRSGKDKLHIVEWHIKCEGLEPIDSFTASVNSEERKNGFVSSVHDSSFGAEADIPYKELIFPPAQPPSAHAPNIIELPDGELFVAWYATAPWGSDAAIWRSSKSPGEKKWAAPSLLCDAPGFADGNPVLYMGKDNKLWLFWTVEKKKRKMWFSSSQLKWRETEIRVKTSSDLGRTWSEARDIGLPSGFLTRNHTIRLNDGQVILPIYMDWNSSAAIISSKDDCMTWSRPKYILRFFGIQPTVIQRADLSLFALMRTGMWPRRSWQAQSDDLGNSWKNRWISRIKNPGSSLEMVKLNNGHVVLVFNDSKKERSKLSLALSYDDGRTWPHVRVIEEDAGYFYPSIMQDSKGLIHVVYSYNWQNSIAHFVTNEEWIKSSTIAN